MEEIGQNVQIETKQGQKSSATVKIRTYSPANRQLRGLFALLICLGLAVISLFIPILHFVLVPIFVLASIPSYILVAARKSLIVGGEGSCPVCNAKFQIAKASDRWPLNDICTSCNSHVHIVKV